MPEADRRAMAAAEVISSAQAAGGPAAPASSHYVLGAFMAACGPTATSSPGFNGSRPLAKSVQYVWTNFN